MFNINFANDWIPTADLWSLKHCEPRYNKKQYRVIDGRFLLLGFNISLKQ